MSNFLSNSSFTLVRARNTFSWLSPGLFTIFTGKLAVLLAKIFFVKTIVEDVEEVKQGTPVSEVAGKITADAIFETAMTPVASAISEVHSNAMN